MGRLLLAGVVVAAVVGGCGSARQVVILPDGGAVAVPSRTDRHMQKALELIRAQCPGGYEVIREEEVPVGSRFEEETTIERDLRDRVTATTEYNVRTRYEWRIHYRCR